MKKVLVAEDSSTMRAIMVKTLSDAGYVVVEVADGELAIDEVSLQAFDIIVTDIEMPKIDGFELCEHIRRSVQNSNTPILVIAGNNDEITKQFAKKSGASGFLSKPLDIDRFLHVARIFSKLSDLRE